MKKPQPGQPTLTLGLTKYKAEVLTTQPQHSVYVE